MDVPGKLIQLKNPFYLDTNSSEHFWHPVGCSSLKMIVSAQRREAVLGNVYELAMLRNYGKNFSVLNCKDLVGCCPEIA